MVAVKRAKTKLENVPTDWSPFYIQPDKDRAGKPILRIRRYRKFNGKVQWETYKGEYDPRGSREDVERSLLQANLRHASEQKKAKEAYEWRHSFITEPVMEEYKLHLSAQIPSKSWQQSMYNYARKNLNWFIEKCRQPDPLEWKALQDRWNMALFCKLEGRDAETYKLWDDKVHPDTISKQVQAVNKLLAWLHDRNPKTFPAVVMKPYSRAVMKDYRSRWKKSQMVGKFITIKDQKIILKEIDPSIRPFVWFGLNFGLRRQESMAIRQKNIRKGHLFLDEQLTSVPDGKPVYEPLKDDDPRNIPYWFSTPAETYSVVEKIEAFMHPDTYSKKWVSEMERLSEKYARSFDYSTHDLRRTFITNAFRAGYNARDIQLAVGHEDITTTMQYAQDDREMDDEIYNPNDAA